MSIKGKITSWNDQKGFGFINPESGDKRIFVHISAFKNSRRRPTVDSKVSYTVSIDKHERPCAVNVALAGDEKSISTRSKGRSLSTVVALTFLAFVGASVVMDRMPTKILVLYVSLSFITFVSYALDKSAAKKGAWRTPENTLHLLSITGGWPGALIAQEKLRHKSKKQSFRTVFWLTVLINCVTFIWLFSPSGAAVLRSFV
jgi:uncharacterized membrane protein YsdA (DUF1294 family)/cold shock CspA family protein